LSSPVFKFDNTYARELSGAYALWQPAAVPAPRLVWLNRALAVELELDANSLANVQGLSILAGNTVPVGAQPLAQAYAGHQFGGFSPQLGDGRALLLGEVVDVHGMRRDIAFKGSGRTPFSRGGDGKAALGPVLREVLIGEAMHALGIPTTRVLAAVATGESVQRELLLPGAILTRVAASHLRVGTFQYFAARKDHDLLRRVADYAIARHDPALVGQPDRYLRFLQAVSERQAALIARWMGVGFIHGVMNTDNMTLSGETIDYGPCAFMEAYDPATVFSSIDLQGRYAYGNQPGIAQWNLARLAETLLPLIDNDSERAIARATEVVNGFARRFEKHRLAVFRAKLGLLGEGLDVDRSLDVVGAEAETPDQNAADDQLLIDDFLGFLEQQKLDFTLTFRALLPAAVGDRSRLDRLLGTDVIAQDEWLERWLARLSNTSSNANSNANSNATRLEVMRHANPAYIARNHQVEAALSAAVNEGDLAPFERLLAVLQSPFDERIEDAEFERPASIEETSGYRTYCGT
jgi:serine/tyrosine/threonine adenylyltransferase